MRIDLMIEKLMEILMDFPLQPQDDPIEVSDAATKMLSQDMPEIIISESYQK